MRFSKIVVGVVIISLSFSLAAAERKQTQRTGGRNEGWGYFMVSVDWPKLDDLNTSFADHGYSRFSDDFLSLGGGGYAVINRIIIGGEGYALLDNNASRGPYRAALSSGVGFFDLGYVLWSADRAKLYSLLGIGGGEWTLKIQERGSASFDELLEDPGRSSTLRNSLFLLSLSAGLDWYIPFSRGRREGGGMSLGLRGGYTFSPVEAEWDIESFEITSGPKMGLTGPFVRIVIGFGGWGRD